MIKLKFTLLFTFFSLTGISSSFLDSLFTTANEHYESEKYTEAIDNYHAILDSYHHSFELYFNLANSYYQFGKIPMSIYYYEKALQIQKSPDATINLALAQKRINLTEPIPQLFYVRCWNMLTMQLSQKQWSVLLIIFTWLTTALLMLFLKKRRKILFNSMLFSLTISFLLAAQMYNANIHENKVYGIILKESKLFDDTINYQSSGNVDSGNKALIIEKGSNMLLIQLEDGQSGWIESDLFKILD